MKKKTTAPKPPAAPATENAPKRADLKQEFGAMVKEALLDTLTIRVTKLVKVNAKSGLLVLPIDDEQVARGQQLAEDVAMLERSACLRIIDRLVTDANLRSRLHDVIITERGRASFAMRMDATFDDTAQKWDVTWKKADEYALAK